MTIKVTIYTFTLARGERGRAILSFPLKTVTGYDDTSNIINAVEYAGAGWSPPSSSFVKKKN